MDSFFETVKNLTIINIKFIIFLKNMKQNGQDYISGNTNNTTTYKQTKKYLQFEPDFYLILNDKIYPTHSNFLSQSKLIAQKLDQGQRTHILKLNIQAQSFQQVLKFIYTSQISLPRNKKIVQLIKICQELKLNDLNNLIYVQIGKNFVQFDFFLMYELGVTYQIQFLLNRCEEELILFQFQQLNQDRNGVLQLSLQSFENLIRKHENLKQNKRPVGLDKQQIMEIIHEYQKNNHCDVDLDDILQPKQTEIKKQNYIDLKQKITKLPSINKNSHDCIGLDQESQKNMINFELSRKNKQMQQEQNNQINDQQIINRIQRNNQMVEQIIDLDYISSPVLIFQDGSNFRIQQFVLDEENVHMEIQKSEKSEKCENCLSCRSKISQVDSFQQDQEESYNEEQLKQKIKLSSSLALKKKTLLTKIPSISKDFRI